MTELRVTEALGESRQTVGDYFQDYDFSDSDLIIVPGTNDRTAKTLTAWTDFIVRRFPQDRQHIVDYPAAIWPLVGGLRAPRYDTSKAIAIERTRESLAHTAGRAVLLSYSQGADATWEAAVQSVNEGDIAPEDLDVILWGHPRRPDALKDVISRENRIISRLFKTAFKAEMNGAWEVDPRIAVTSIAINGDPITSFPSLWPHPLRFGKSFAAGYFMLHSGLGYEGAAQLEKLSIARAETVPGTATTYLDVDAEDPLSQARAWIQSRRQKQQLADTASA